MTFESAVELSNVIFYYYTIIALPSSLLSSFSYIFDFFKAINAPCLSYYFIFALAISTVSFFLYSVTFVFFSIKSNSTFSYSIFAPTSTGFGFGYSFAPPNNLAIIPPPK